MKWIGFFLLFFIFACQQPKATSNIDKSGLISHVVLFDTKDSLTSIQLDTLMLMLHSLKEIPGVKHMEVGIFKDLNDPRALNKYEYVIQMEFENKQAYKNYQGSPIHLAVKKKLGPFLAVPPVSYDYLID